MVDDSKDSLAATEPAKADKNADKKKTKTADKTSTPKAEPAVGEAEQIKIDDFLKQESIAKIKQNWAKHLALTATFAYRGSFIKMFAENSAVPVRPFLPQK